MSGLSEQIVQQLKKIEHLQPWVACILVVVVASTATEIAANAVVISLLLPILAQVVRLMLEMMMMIMIS